MKIPPNPANLPDVFQPLKNLEHVDLYYNPKLFQPGFDSCSLPISRGLSGLEHHANFANLGKMLKKNNYLYLYIKIYICLNSGFAKNSLATVPTDVLEFVKNTLRKVC